MAERLLAAALSAIMHDPEEPLYKMQWVDREVDQRVLCYFIITRARLHELLLYNMFVNGQFVVSVSVGDVIQPARVSEVWQLGIGRQQESRIPRNESRMPSL